MPTIEISKKDFAKLLGKKLNFEELEKAFTLAKAEIKKNEKDPDLLNVELKDVNRPDLWNIEGLSRELRTKLGIKTGIPKYSLSRGNYDVKVDKKVKKIRPIIACAVVKDVKFNDEFIKQLIQTQEKLCETFGRKRKEASIGIYDFDKISWPITYTTSKPDSLKFKPLGLIKEQTLREILKEHEKGKEYGHLISEFKEYPILIDSKKNILSMPPIINSDYSGKVTEETKNILIEVTGLSERFTIPVLNIVAAAFAERGYNIEKVRIKHGLMKAKETPDFENQKFEVNIKSVNEILGLDLNHKQVTLLLLKSGFDIPEYKKSKKQIKRQKKKQIEEDRIMLMVPAWRQDILDERDIIEDIAISYGYDKFKTKKPEIVTIGKKNGMELFIEKVSNLLIGLECQEIATFNLTNKNILFRNMRLTPASGNVAVVELENPISENYSCLRNWLLPGILDWLSVNKNARYPQRVFEIGKSINIHNNEAIETTKLCFVIANSRTDFTEAKQILDWVFTILGLKYELSEISHQSFIDGRTGKIKSSNEEIGLIGEVHPGVLEKFNFSVPAVAFELDLEKLFNLLKTI